MTHATFNATFFSFFTILFTCFISSFNTLFNIINLLLVKNEKIKRSENLSQSFSQLEGEITVVWILAYSVITRALPVAMSLPKIILSTLFQSFNPLQREIIQNTIMNKRSGGTQYNRVRPFQSILGLFSAKRRFLDSMSLKIRYFYMYFIRQSFP